MGNSPFQPPPPFHKEALDIRAEIRRIRQTRHDVSTPLTSGDTSPIDCPTAKADYQFNQDLFDVVKRLNDGHICTLFCHQVASFMTSPLRQRCHFPYEFLIPPVSFGHRNLRSSNHVGPVSPQKNGQVIRQLLSSQYSFNQDSTIHIPWWRKKPGRIWWECERKRGTWIFEAQNESTRREDQGWLGSVSNTIGDIRSPPQRRRLLARRCQPRLEVSKAPTSSRVLLNSLNGGPPKRHPP